jgi:hypothetical protein
LVDQQLAFKNAQLLLPDRPGLGFGFEAANRKRCMIDACA